MQKLIVRIGYLLFFILLATQLYYFAERVLYLDSAYNVFNVINTEWFSANHHRYSIYLCQLLPVLFSKLSIPLKWILLSYSIGGTLIALLLYFILIKLGQWRVALLLLLMQFLPTKESWFLAHNETILCINFLLLSVGIYIWSPSSKRQIIPLIACLISLLIAAYSHPLFTILALFILLYIFVADGFNKFTITYGLLYIAIVILQILTKENTGYEQNLVGQFGDVFQILAHITDTNSFKYYLSGLNTNQYFKSVLFWTLLTQFIILLYYFLSKKIKLALTYFSITLCMWLLIIVAFNQGDGNIFMEKNFAPYIFLVFLPFAFFSFHPALYGVVLLLGGVLTYINVKDVKHIYSNRLLAIGNTLTDNENNQNAKFIVQDSLVNKTIWQGTWALPYESIMWSKMKLNKCKTIRVYKNEEYINKALHRTDIFLTADFFPVDIPGFKLNPTYFNLPNENYKVLKKLNP